MAGDRPLPFLDKLRDSGLLTAAQLKELSLLPEAGDSEPRPLGLHALKSGWLTRFQINVIAKGRGQDLTFGSYVVLDSLGEGAMGQVFKAHHQRMGRVVALKVIRKEKLASPAAVQRFYQEVKAAAQLSHPNIVIAYDAGSIGATHYLAMEYVDGIDLSRLVKESGSLNIPLAARREACAIRRPRNNRLHLYMGHDHWEGSSPPGRVAQTACFRGHEFLRWSLSSPRFQPSCFALGC
jgi:hypothetical protein